MTTDVQPTAAQVNADAVRRLYAAYAAGDRDAIEALVDDDVTLHVPGRHPLSGTHTGRTEVVNYLNTVAGFSQGHPSVDVHTLLADGDHAVALAVATSKHGDRVFVRSVVHVWHVTDGVVTELWQASTDQHAEDEFWAAALGDAT